MRLLLDTHVFLALLDLGSVPIPSNFELTLNDANVRLHVSVASLWEIAIKARARRLDIGMDIEGLADACDAGSMTILPIDHRHVLARVDPEPATRDPFDRLLLAQAGVEGMRLVTLDRALASHPLAWSPAA